MRRLTVMVSLALILVAQAAAACPVCFGDPNSPMTKGMNSAIIFLLGIVGFIWVAFAALFFTFWRKARALRRHREQFHLLSGGLR
jgi:heme/copper-type cytochrome/quinol oxidase subunit 2